MAGSGSGNNDSNTTVSPQDRAEVRDPSDPKELSLEEVLKSYEQPINEEQAWAVCYQSCRGLSQLLPGVKQVGFMRVKDPGSILLHKDGTVSLLEEIPALLIHVSFFFQTVQSLGFAIYRALDWGLDENEERELSPQLEQLIDLMANGDSEAASSGTADEGYSGQEEEEEPEMTPRAVRSFLQVMSVCSARLSNPSEAQTHYQAVCRALFVETLELQTFLTKIRDAKEMLKKINTEEQEERLTAELDNLRHTDWVRIKCGYLHCLRRCQTEKSQEKQFNPVPTEFQLTPFEMLMQDIRARNYKLRKVMVDGDIPTRLKKDAHELILDFIRSRPPLKPASERSLRPRPEKTHSLHEKILHEIKQERKLRPVKPPCCNRRNFGSLPCIIQTYSSDVKSTSCIDLSVPDGAGRPPPQRPRVLLKAPTLAEMEEMNISEEEESPNGEIRRVASSPVPLKRDRSFSEQDLAFLQSEMAASQSESTYLARMGERTRSGSMVNPTREPMISLQVPYCQQDEFSYPVETLALTVDEVINVRKVLVKAEMEKFQQCRELYNNLKKGKVCCCCRVKFPLFSWPSNCLFCKRCFQFLSVRYTMFICLLFLYRSLQSLSCRSVEEEFPHLYANGCSLKDICTECTKFVGDVITSSRKSVDILNNTPRKTKSLRVPSGRCAKYK
uniref:Spire-type actin nucleation factor 2 n=1 Tax=Erpetoichthys calabaricus TaxID=27687 RepID=A0A8C4XFV7_ERPCA